MCTSPIIIRNQRKRFIPYVDKHFLSVPCGKCLECRNRKRNDLFILSYFEHLQAVASGGFTQFFTLTYDDSSLPRYASRPCFSREDIQNYFKRVTSAFKRTFGNDFKFRRLVTCEYGSQNRRPHYHALIFIQRPCNHFTVRKILRECWRFGFSFGSWDNFGEVNRPNGIRYVTKYVCKDTFDDELDREILQEAKDWSAMHYYAQKRVLPFVLHSKRYGFCALDHLTNDSSPLPVHLRTPLDVILSTGKIRMFDNSGVVKLLPLPRSLYRHLLFDITWRYKRVTKRDVKLHEIHGTKCPKKKVQSYYIPNHLYSDFYKNSVNRKLDNLKIKLQEVSSSVSADDIRFSLLRPDFSVSNVIPDYSFENYIDKLIKINCERDPIYERDPFSGEFSYKRAPLEKSYFPELKSYIMSLFSSHSSSLCRSMDNLSDYRKKISACSNFSIEKTYRDNKLILYA